MKCPVCNIDEEPLYPPRKWYNGKYFLSYRCTECGHMSREEKPRYIVEANIEPGTGRLIFYIRDNETEDYTKKATPNARDGFYERSLAETVAEEWNNEDACWHYANNLCSHISPDHCSHAKEINCPRKKDDAPMPTE